MAEVTPISVSLSPLDRRSVEGRFDVAAMSSDAGVLWLAEVERKLGIADALASCVRDCRDPGRILHSVADMMRFRMLAIAAGYEDGDDCDVLRRDPAFKLALGELPETGAPLCSQPTISRLENMPGKREIARMVGVQVDLFCRAFSKPPRDIVLDIDDTPDPVHGGQQMALFNGYRGVTCFLPMHIYEANTGLPVAVIFRDGRPPKGTEVRTVIKRLVQRIRRHWPAVNILVRGDSHYGRPEAMDWMEANGVDYILGLGTNARLVKKTRELADDVAVRRAEAQWPAVRRYQSFSYQAGSWSRDRRVIARIEASHWRGLDRRFIVTSLKGKPKRLYEKLYCARGQAENLIFAHKVLLASDRTSCSSPTANQFRIILHTAAFMLLHHLRAAMPKRSIWRNKRFDTIRLGLIKIAALIEEKRTRIIVRMPQDCPTRFSLAAVAMTIIPAPP